MSDRFVVDPPQLDLRLKQLRLPAMRTLWRTASPSAPTARGGPRCARWPAMSGYVLPSRSDNILHQL